MSRGLLWAALGAGGLLLLVRSDAASYSFGGAPLKAGVDRDPQKLLPGFARKLENVFQRMRARGYQPLLWEGYRTQARASQLATAGTGVDNSLHILGAAADIVDGSAAPNYWKGGDALTSFWVALGEEAERAGLTWGGRFSKRDAPHVQAVSVKEQNAFRAMTSAERERYVA